MTDRVRLATSTAIVLLFLSAAPVLFGQHEGGAIVAIDEPASGTGNAGGAKAYGGTTSQKKGQTPKQKGGKSTGTTASTRPKTMAAPPARVATAWNGPVLGDKYTFLNFEVVSAAKPYHTREAKANGAKGLVQVEVLIGTDGSVLAARARTGNPLLHPEAERAALESKFNRPTLNGQPARATGFLVYRFGPAED